MSGVWGQHKGVQGTAQGAGAGGSLSTGRCHHSLIHPSSIYHPSIHHPSTIHPSSIHPASVDCGPDTQQLPGSGLSEGQPLRGKEVILTSVPKKVQKDTLEGNICPPAKASQGMGCLGALVGYHDGGQAGLGCRPPGAHKPQHPGVWEQEAGLGSVGAPAPSWGGGWSPVHRQQGPQQPG